MQPQPQDVCMPWGNLNAFRLFSTLTLLNCYMWYLFVCLCRFISLCSLSEVLYALIWFSVCVVCAFINELQYHFLCLIWPDIDNCEYNEKCVSISILQTNSLSTLILFINETNGCGSSPWNVQVHKHSGESKVTAI